MKHDPSRRRTALIVTGEASGDLHAASLIRAARKIDPELDFIGVGGRHMEAEGCEIIFRGEELAVVGLLEVLAHFSPIYKAFKQLERLLHGPDRPDVLVLIDFPEFNLRLAAKAKAAGVPVLYYVSPQVWAWRRGRVKTIARRVDRLAAIFPFEPELYQGLPIDVQYVGHPLVDDCRLTQGREDYLRSCGLDPQSPVVGLFPGSRRNELKYIFPTILDTARSLLRQRADLQFLLPVASSLEPQVIKNLLGDLGESVTVVQDSIYDTAHACDAVISVSGTVTLQIALVNTPLVILYKMNPLSYWIGKQLIKLPNIGLVNIVAGSTIVREFIQHDAQPQMIAEEILTILADAEYRQQIKQGLHRVGLLLGDGGCSEKVAHMASQMSRTQESVHAIK